MTQLTPRQAFVQKVERRIKAGTDLTTYLVVLAGLALLFVLQ